MPVEWGAIAVLATAVLSLFGYVLATSHELNKFKIHVAEKYVQDGAIDSLTKAIEKLTEKLEAVSTKVAIIVDRATK